MTSRLSLEERRAQALRDLEEVDAQEASGELDAETADRLRATYRQEAAGVDAALDDLDDKAGTDGPAAGASRRRLFLGAGALAAAAAVVVFVLVQSVEDRGEGEFITGNDQVAGGRDLSAVSNAELEEVVADNPDILPMRLALAGRYFEAGNFSAALPHYLVVLELDATNAEALAHTGWMTYLSGEPETASSLLERALATEPEYLQAALWQAEVLVYGLDQPARAVPLLDLVEGSAELPAEVGDRISQIRSDIAS